MNDTSPAPLPDDRMTRRAWREYAAPEDMVDPAALAPSWRGLVLRGAAALVFAAVAILWPEVTLATLIGLFAAYLFIDGVFAISVGVRASRAGRRWWPFILQGMANIVAGSLALALPDVTLIVLLALMAFWGVASGVLMLRAGATLNAKGRWLLILNGAVSVAFGLTILFFPVAGVLALIWLTSAYALLFGIILIAMGLKLRKVGPRATHGEQREFWPTSFASR